jgi:type IV secretion system protein TrbE
MARLIGRLLFGFERDCHGIPTSSIRRCKHEGLPSTGPVPPNRNSYIRVLLLCIFNRNNIVSTIMPDGYFYEDHMVFGDPGNGSVIARGYAVDFPDLSASDDQAFIDLESDIRLILGSLKTDERLQVQFYTCSDYSGPLTRFLEDTNANSRLEFSSKVRNELVFRYRDRVACETLIQANVRLYISSQLPKFVTDSGRKVRGFDEVFKVLRQSFDSRRQFFDLLLRSYGGNVHSLDNADHYSELLKFWSPGQARVWNPKKTDIDLLRTITDLCQFSELAPRREPEQGFYLDGHCFGLMVFRTMPRATWPKTFEPFFALGIPNLRVVVNMQPLAVETEMRYEEERFTKLVSNIDPQSPSLQSEVGLDKHRERMRRLMSNQVLPFRAQTIVIAHDRTGDGLGIKMEALRAVIGKTGAEPYRPLVATSTLAFFNCATPGFGPWVPYRDFWHKIDDLNLANLWPAGSTPRADLESADWIADGDQNNLIGGRSFLGAQPVHMLVIGSTGSGKSVLLQATTLQTALRFGFIVVVDDGLSWLTTCQKLDPTSRPIIVRSNGNQTFNIFDTRSLPLSAEHLASATALCHLLVGQSRDEDKDKLRAAVLSDSINEVYGVAYRTWRNRHPELHYTLCRETAILLKFQLANGMEDFLDAFLEARQLRNANPTALLEFEDDINDDEAFALARNPKTEHLVRNLAFAAWTSEMFPTLSDLQDELHTAALQKGSHQEVCATLASLLRPWLRDGRFGPIVDGASNIDLGSLEFSENTPLKVVHFDLGKIGKSEAELRAVVGFLITNQVRNHVQGMPRAVRKQVVIEEMTSFLKIPNGEEIIIDFYERFRKYSAQVVSVFQHYSTLLEAHPKVAHAILGNSDAMMLLRNPNRKDLETLSSFVYLPQVIRDKIASFPKPADMTGLSDAYAGFVYVQLDGEQPRFTVARNVISEELERITSSSGDKFEEKLRELKES